MDRTIIAVQRAEERELGERLYKKLQGLALLHPPSKEFRECISEEMFLKPNQQAFFQVMHFLFCLLDAAEFKKRFYWPITDKRAEASFRTSTVEYLNHLNEKHHLQWGNIKSYLVVLPGGKKFIMFLLDLVAFVVQEQIRQHERQLNADAEAVGQASDLNLRRMRRQNEFFKEYAAAYISEMEEHMAKRQRETKRLQQLVQTLAQETGLSVAQLTNEAWQEEFNQHNEQFYQQTYSARVADITSLEQPLMKLKEVVDGFQSKEAELKYDKASVRQALQKIREHFPLALSTLQCDEDAFVRPGAADTVGGDDLKLSVLISVFNATAPTLACTLAETPRLPDCSEFVSTELSALQRELQRIEGQITDFQKMLNTQLRKRHNQKQVRQQETPLAPSTRKQFEDNALLMKFVYTPPIKLDVTGSGERPAKLRLPLFTDGNMKSSESFSNFLCAPRSARRLRPTECSLELNNTLNKSKIVDPIQLLRTISKGISRGSRTDYNLSTTLGGRWRERQYLLHSDLGTTPTTIITAPTTIITAPTTIITAPTNQLNNSLAVDSGQTALSTSPFTPFNNNDRTRIARNHLLEAISSSSGSGGGGASAGANTSASTKAFYARQVRKVQDDSLNIANMSSSPSGRLDALVTPDAVDAPKLRVYDITLQKETTITLTASHGKHCRETVEVLETSDTHVLLTAAAKENDANIANQLPGTPARTTTHPSLNLSDDDDLFDISDSVLKDVLL